jgi:hypothetical protein
VIITPLRSNEHGADLRKHGSSIVARVRFRLYVFTEPLPSNELFKLSGVMSQYYPHQRLGVGSSFLYWVKAVKLFLCLIN